MRPLDEQQPRRIARARGAKGDAVGRKVEVEEVDAHYCGVGASSGAGSSAAGSRASVAGSTAGAGSAALASGIGAGSLAGAAGATASDGGAVGEAGPAAGAATVADVGAGAGVASGAGAAAIAGGAGNGPPMLARTIRVGCAGGSPTAIWSTAAIPSTTRPKALYLWSSLNVGPSMMKNWLLAELGTSVRAIDVTPRRWGKSLNSAARSGSFDPPAPVPVGSPPWAMKPGITRWKASPL